MNEAGALARRCAAALWADDAASQGLGMTLDHVAAGSSRLSMAVPSCKKVLKEVT